MYLICYLYKDCKERNCPHSKPYDYNMCKPGTKIGGCFHNKKQSYFILCTPFQYEMYKASKKDK